MRRLLAIVVLLVLVAAACGDDADTVTTEDPGNGTRPSVAGDWILRELTVDGAVVPLPDDEIEMTIQLGEISGTLGCNSFFGEVDAADDGSLTIGSLGQTEMACVDEGRMDFEFSYALALGVATRWVVDPGGLTLSSETVEIRYEQAPLPVHQPLEETVWHFDTEYSGEGVNRAASNSSDMDGVTLVISAGEAVLSSPDCDGTVSAVTYEDGRDGSFTVTEAGGVIEPASCDPVARAHDGLIEATGFMIDENRLTFIGAHGETVGFSAPA